MGALEIVLWVIAVGWLLAVLTAILNLLLVPRLGPPSPPEGLPTLSVVVPARNEEEGIEAGVASHCTQDYPGLEVVVVDDGSTDDTPTILAGLEARFPNLVVSRGGELPEGWLGKPNALRQGLERATGEYVLLADADVRYDPGTHRRAMGEVLRHRLDTLVLMSQLEARGLEPLVQSVFAAMALYQVPTYLVNLVRSELFAFVSPSGILVRRDALEAAGGIAGIRSAVVDDLALGRMMKAHSARYRLVAAFSFVHHRIYKGLRGSMEGFAKVAFHIFDRRFLLATLVQTGHLAGILLPLATVASAAALPVPPELLFPSAVALGSGVVCNFAAALWARQPLWIAVAFPLRQVLWSWIGLRSAARYYRRGLLWRGRVYDRVC